MEIEEKVNMLGENNLRAAIEHEENLNN